MAKLNQIIAVEKGVKGATHEKITNAYHTLQKTPLFAGLARTYQPKDEEGESLPPESQRVQVKVADQLDEVATALTKLFDITLTKDATNAVAKADVVVEGSTLIADVPVPYLLFLEKQLTDLHTLVKKLPTLDPGYDWSFNDIEGLYSTSPVQTTRTKKIPRNHVVAEATPEHAAQVQVYHEDVIVGTWTKTDFSGAVPATRINELTSRVEKLQQAVKYAREQANTTDVVDRQAGDAVFSYLFA